ncbi:thermonuclease family protein [Agrobacterium tumefaciens]|uniref:thermonuclease family protein n=1 Tax=Agrobacterium tumefaciens TaxID=358 RepID=UPI00157305A3|nr:thermonuclease family protein [Agrobacterium tumefaciens]NTE37652.1 thermonuclease family protein [Agrobacterium tumefaciens]NTE53164.1 thermonuclease family protein [Agrobacterium tumefaciens]
MKHAKKNLLGLLLVISAAMPSDGRASDNTTPITVSKNAELQTGDTWKDGDKTYRLYGVQSCLRGTSAIGHDDERIDCGSASLAQLMAVMSSSRVTCQPIGFALDRAIFVICGAEIGGNTLDLGTALISTGYAFAAADMTGKAVNANYLVAEINAKVEREGLWAMTFQHPVSLLLREAASTK